MVYLIPLSVILLLFIPFNLIFKYKDKKVEIKLIFFKVIKINLKAKTKIKKRRKRAKIKIQDITGFLNTAQYLLKKIKLNISFNLEYGFSSPHLTGLYYGILNSLIYTVYGYLTLKLKEFIFEPKIIPDFKNEKFIISIEGVLTLKPINLIMFIFKFAIYYFKNKKRKVLKNG